MQTVNIYDAKTRFSQLMDKVAAGEDVVISRHGMPLVRLTQLAESTRRVRFGVLRGKVKVAVDFDARLPDHVLAEFEGGWLRLLLDTHVCLWVVIGSPRLTAAARSLIESAEQTFVSAASIWEIGIKARLGKIEADADELVAAIGQSGFMELPVRTLDVAAAARLPLDHGDSFDRVLVGQAITEPLRLLTDDAALARYSELVVLV